MREILDLLDSAAKRYPIKALAEEIDKGESTLRNELTSQPGYKLGLTTALLIMKKTGDFTALDKIEARFGRVSFAIPKHEKNVPLPVIRMLPKLSREFGATMTALGKSIDDGRLSKKEAVECREEILHLVKAAMQIDAYLSTLM